MAGYTYATYTAALQVMMVSQAPDAPFDTILPSIIDYASLRIDRDLNLISAVSTDSTTLCVVGERLTSIPQTFVTVTEINVLSPAGTTSSDGSRAPLTPVARPVVDNLWPTNSTTYRGLPKMFAMVDQWSIVLGPSPDDTYALEIVGTTHPAVLSASVTTTFISENLPDLFMAASMVFAALYQRNFGGGANDPGMVDKWESEYQLLKASADNEETRKRFAGASWTSQPVIPQAQPQRG